MENSQDMVRPDRFDVELAAAKTKRDELTLRLTVTLIALLIIGGLVCLVLSAIKMTVDALLAVGLSLLAVALLGMWGYHALKSRVIQRRYDRRMSEIS